MENHPNKEHLVVIVVIVVSVVAEVDFEEEVEEGVAVEVAVVAEDEEGAEVEVEIDMVEAEIVVVEAEIENVIMVEDEMTTVADLEEVATAVQEGVMAVAEVDMNKHQREGDMVIKAEEEDMIKEEVMVVMPHNLREVMVTKVVDRMPVVMAHLLQQTMVNNKVINKCLKLMQDEVIKLQPRWVKGMPNLLLKSTDNQHKEVMTKDVVDTPHQEDLNNHQREGDMSNHQRQEGMSNNQREEEKDKMPMEHKEVLIKDSSSMHNNQQLVVTVNKQAFPNIRMELKLGW